MCVGGGGVYIYTVLFESLGYVRFIVLKKSYVHEGCINLIKNTLKQQ